MRKGDTEAEGACGDKIPKLHVAESVLLPTPWHLPSCNSGPLGPTLQASGETGLQKALGLLRKEKGWRLALSWRCLLRKPTAEISTAQGRHHSCVDLSWKGGQPDHFVVVVIAQAGPKLTLYLEQFH